MLITKINLTYLEKTEKYIILVYFTINWDVIVNINIFLFFIDKPQIK